MKGGPEAYGGKRDPWLRPVYDRHDVGWRSG